MPPHGGPRPTNRSLNWVWDINTLAWVMMTQPLISGGTVIVSGTVAVTGPLTDAQLRATPVPVSGTVTTGGLTNAELRAVPVVITGAVVVL